VLIADSRILFIPTHRTSQNISLRFSVMLI
jgi:hypothetical protein